MIKDDYVNIGFGKLSPSIHKFEDELIYSGLSAE
jgi:hypothetical protein